MKINIRTLGSTKSMLLALTVSALSFSCAPITPMPGGTQNSPPSLPSAGGAPGSPSSSPGGLPGGTSTPGGSQPGGQSPSSGGGTSGGGLPGSTSGAPGQSGGTPGTGSDGNGSQGKGDEPEPTWETETAEGGLGDGDGDGGGDSDGDWETSNELPGGDAEDVAEGKSGSSEGDNRNEPSNGSGDGSADDELDGALKDFDGEILAERDIIQEASKTGPSGSIELPTIETSDDQDGAGSNAQTGGPLPPRKIVMPNAPPPRRGTESMPDNIPDAKDDDIIARQLREAAMAENDLELKEKLWQEYRKYKKG